MGRLLVQVAGPAAEPVDLDMAKLHCRIESGDDDAKLTRLIKVARQRLDGRDGVLGRALITQTWTLKLDRFCDRIELPLPPLQSVQSITYIDPLGAMQTLDAELYQVVGVGGFAEGAVLPSFGASWPDVRCQPEAVSITFVAGYGGADDVPEPIREAILEMVAHWHMNREATGAQVYELPLSAADLITPYRLNWFA